MNNRERLKLIIENWFIEKTSIKPTDEGLNNLVDRIYYDKQLIIGGVSFELPSDDIFDMSEVRLNNPLEEFYYYERPAYLEDDQKEFRERLQKALNYLKGN